jgi:hypothetical protein
MELDASQVVITIPTHKSEITENEKLCLKQCDEVLSRYRKVLLVPEGLDTRAYTEIVKDLEVKYYDKYYFSSYLGYDELCLSPDFYKGFEEHEYLLIYQTDCWIFRDELLDWCNKGYDYIGAPWIDLSEPTRKAKPIIDIRPIMKGKVGNGGFSLRKISTMKRNSKWLIKILPLWRKTEDTYWSLIVPMIDWSFKKPKMHEALKFAFETSPSKCYSMNQSELPFGCHAWEKYEPEFWSEFIPYKPQG